MKKTLDKNYVDLNFKGFANSVQSTDIKLPPPTPLPNYQNPVKNNSTEVYTDKNLNSSSKEKSN